MSGRGETGMKQNNKLLIAVTGGIGSGKSEVIKVLATLGANIISSDKINRELLTEPSYISKMEAVFMKEKIVENGVINKKKLAELVFSNDKALRKLNALAHPEIFRKIAERAREMDGVVFVEVPLLIETNQQGQFDRVWLVKANTELRIERLKKRDNLTREEALRIMAKQTTDTEREKYATEIIENDGDEHGLALAVKALYDRL